MQNFPIDLVVTYVDDRDPVWQKAIQQYNIEDMPSRYRSWDIFKYWFRGVENHMPFIRTIHLVVSNIEQVPKWLDQDKVHVVLHKDIIPQQLLPTFNSTTIEMYLHKIDGLSEHFIYSNDDMMPMNSMQAGDFFTDEGLPIYQLSHKEKADSIFWQMCKRSYQLAAKLAVYGIDSVRYFLPKHSMNPMLKSVLEEVHEKASEEIYRSCTKFREPWNFTQYLFPDYTLMTKRGIEGVWSFGYFRLDDCQTLFKALAEDKSAIVCMNDNGVEHFDENKYDLVRVLDDIYPEKCRYEKEAN